MAHIIPKTKNRIVMEMDTFLFFIIGLSLTIFLQLFNLMKCLYKMKKRPTPIRIAVINNKVIPANARGTPMMPNNAK